MLNRVVWVTERGFDSLATRSIYNAGGGHYLVADWNRNASGETKAALARTIPSGQPAGEKGPRCERSQEPTLRGCHNPEPAQRAGAARANLIGYPLRGIDGSPGDQTSRNPPEASTRRPAVDRGAAATYHRSDHSLCRLRHVWGIRMTKRLARLRSQGRRTTDDGRTTDDKGGDEGGAAGATRKPLLIRSLEKWFGETPAVDGVTLTVNVGECLVLLGPSGCGKTTTLRLVAGFLRPDAGSIAIGERVLADESRFIPPEDRQMAVVFQSYALWPHMTVGDNVAFGPKLRTGRKADVAEEVATFLNRVQLPNLAGRYPHELSGGQQQRVALARAIINRPDVLLLDEPLSNLDTQLREDLRREIKGLQRDLAQTMIYVTHDQTEALSLADRVAVMRLGKIEQLGPPQELYEQPHNSYVARALGPTNIVKGKVLNGSDACVDAFVPGIAPVRSAWSGRDCQRDEVVSLSIRPGSLSLSPCESGSANGAVVVDVVYLGDVVHYAVDLPEADEPLRILHAGPVVARAGEKVNIEVRPGAAAVLSA
jgi:ABC-type Fe3+/spermidine/putrescine transport system ATPase subunit